MDKKEKLSIFDKTKPWFNSPEKNFFIYCSRSTINEQIKENLKTLSDSGLDWSSIVSKAKKQGVVQFLYLHLSRWDEIWSIIPEESKNDLKQFYYNTLTKNLSIQRELKQVISLLNHNQISVIALKGAGLLETVYKNIALRPMVDVDLLVERRDFSMIKSILLDAGYQRPAIFDQESLEKFGGEIRLNKTKGIFLDIHSNLSQYERFENIFKIDLDDEVWTKSRKYKTREGEIRILNPIHLIMHLCMHHAIGHTFTGLFRFCDIRETIYTFQKDLDWDELVVKAGRYKIKKIIYYSLLFTQELFGQIVSDDILDSLRPTRKQAILTSFFISEKKILSLPDSDEEAISKKPVNQLFLMDNFLNIPKIVARGLFPSNEWLKYRYGVKKKIELIFYRLFHPLIAVFNILS